MARYHATVKSRSSAAETFGYMAAFSNAAEWDPGVLAGEQLDPGPVRAGSRFRLVVPFLGARVSLTYEVIRFVPGREVVLHAANAVLRSTDRIIVTGAADRSTVSYDAQVRLRGPLRLLDPLLRPGFRAVAERAAAGLAGALSRRPPGRGTRAARPILLTPQQGADTIVWLAAMPPELLGSGRFWHDRRPRPEYPLPWTRGHDSGAARELWDHLAAATAAGTPKLAQAGLDSVAADHDISSQGQR
jgi:hypothetical protein